MPLHENAIHTPVRPPRVSRHETDGSAQPEATPLILEPGPRINWESYTMPEAQVVTDEWGAYRGINREHVTVKHREGQYVVDGVSTNGIESHLAMLKRGIYGVYHHVSQKHLNRYASEFAGRHNSRSSDTVD